ncbi:gamma-glutamylcyclotransferase family protein [Candidatus Solincola tengchongensis]|uniref:gamma-glutamylcyclotransferase family protein n=1 Tax=Candidatus Solincola tengchongensis TaxID=2900693 RepID=UPI0025805CB0|nr:gamma-glutamylcyclotransferase family protein [Candidatus Solincola tengchongensis]
MEETPIFVYGTLKPGEKMFRHISHTVRDAIPACVPGRLYETPFGYPLLVRSGGEDEIMINGVLLVPLEGCYEEMVRIIDVIEGEAGFEKGEMEVVLGDGHRVEAIVYYYREAPPYAQPYYGNDWPATV